MDSSAIAVFDLLPDEDVVGILSKIENLNDLFSLCRTSARIDKICQDPIFWKNKYKQDFGDKYLPDGDLKLPYIIRTKAKESNLLSSGHKHAGMVDKNGILHMWGDNEYGQLGDGMTSSREEPVKIPFESKVICISCGYQSTAAVTENGEVFIWGRDQHATTPKKVNIPSKIVKVSLGPDLIKPNTAALSEDGLVYHWYFGNPQLVPTTIKMIDIASTFGFSIGIREFSYLSMISEDMKLYHFIVKGGSFFVKIRPLPEPILSVSDGFSYAGVLSISGNVYLYGANGVGQLGTGHPGLIVPETGLYDTINSTDDLNKISLSSPIILLSCRYWVTSAITLDNKLYMWGSNVGNKIFIEKDPRLLNVAYQELFPKGYFLAGNDANKPPSFNIEISNGRVTHVGSKIRFDLSESDERSTITFPSLATPTQIDIGYPVTSISTGTLFSIAKTSDGRVNQWDGSFHQFADES